MMSSEIHLFIIWEKGRCYQEKILTDIAQHFTILKQYEITWTPSLVESNFTRFCGTRLGNNLQFKIANCGIGDFLVIVVRDENPIYEKRSTFHGTANVNVKMFEAKQRYREWTGGGIRVHATDDMVETNHDLTLLTGKNVNDFLSTNSNSNLEKLNSDLVGASVWNTIEELFYVLNNTVHYAVMSGVSKLTKDASETLETTDIITDDRDNFLIILNSPILSSEIHKSKTNVQIGENTYILNIWNGGWNANLFFDPQWSRNMINSAILCNGIKILNPRNDFYRRLYSSLIHKGYIADGYLPELQRYKSEFELIEKDWNKILVDFLKENYYEIPKPDKKKPLILTNPDIAQYAMRFGVCTEIKRNKENSIAYFKKKDTIVKKGPQSIIGNEQSILKQIGDGMVFPKLIDSGTEGENCWIELSYIKGIDLGTYMANRRRVTLEDIKNLWVSILDILEQLQKFGVAFNHLSESDIIIKESSSQVAFVNFEDAFFTQDEKDFAYNLLSVSEIFKTRFGVVKYIREVSVAKNLKEAREKLDLKIDMKSRYVFCKRKYGYVKTYVKHPQLIISKMFHS